MSIFDWVSTIGSILFFGGIFIGFFATVDKDSMGEGVAGYSIIIGAALLLVRWGIVYLIFHL